MDILFVSCVVICIFAYILKELYLTNNLYFCGFTYPIDYKCDKLLKHVLQFNIEKILYPEYNFSSLTIIFDNGMQVGILYPTINSACHPSDFRFSDGTKYYSFGRAKRRRMIKLHKAIKKYEQREINGTCYSSK